MDLATEHKKNVAYVLTNWEIFNFFGTGGNWLETIRELEWFFFSGLHFFGGKKENRSESYITPIGLDLVTREKEEKKEKMVNKHISKLVLKNKILSNNLKIQKHTEKIHHCMSSKIKLVFNGKFLAFLFLLQLSKKMI